MRVANKRVVDPNEWTWWYRLVAYWIAVDLALIGLACCFGPKRWFTANSLQHFHDHVPIPWPYWGGLFLACAVSIAFRRLRIWGYALAAVLASWFVGLALAFTVLANQITNPITIGLAGLAPLMLLAGIRYAALVDRR